MKQSYWPSTPPYHTKGCLSSGTLYLKYTHHPAFSYISHPLPLPQTLTFQCEVSKKHAECSRCFMPRKNAIILLEEKGKAFILVIMVQAAEPLKTGCE